ncbi:hypothetical protein LSAT2_030838 [Lamellibrachia satsuma]|nr:hypothetical protein LSAT2_030838 [Lamellibrachia satsuma]
MSITIDISSRLMYYTDSNYQVIAAMTLDGHHHFTVISDLYGPYDIALDQAHGLLYWGEGLGIFVAAMDGTGQRVLHTGYGGSGLSLDMKGDRIYWREQGRIQSLSTDGGDRIMLTHTTDSQKEMTLLGHNLFYPILSDTGEEVHCES